MRHLSDKIKIRKILKDYEVIIVRTYIDDFGKEFTTIKLWDSYASKGIAVAESDIQIQSMRNCGYKV